MRMIYEFQEVCQFTDIQPHEDIYTVLSKIYGVTIRTVRNWEKNNHVPSKYPMKTIKESLHNVARPF